MGQSANPDLESPDKDGSGLDEKCEGLGLAGHCPIHLGQCKGHPVESQE